MATRVALRSSSSSSKKGKKEGGMPSMHAPQRNLLQEGRDGLQLMQEAYPQLYGLQNQYNPQFAELEARTGATRSAAEVAGARASGTSIRDTLRGASPEIAAGGDALLAGLQGVGPSAIETELQNQALSELRMGGDLSADEIRQVTQGSRAAGSARGLSQSHGAAVTEVMSRAAMAEARKGQRRNFAAGVDVNAQQRRASDNSYVLNANNQAMGQYDVFDRIYGRGGSQVSGQVSGPSVFGNYLDAAGEVGRGNQSAALQGMAMEQDNYQFGVNRKDSLRLSRENLANANANAAAARRNATGGSLLGTLGAIGGALIGKL